MKKKQNVYKRKRNFHFLSTISTVVFSLLLVSFFALIGYSVAKPFGSVGEAKNKSSSDLLPDINDIPAEKNLSDSMRAYWLPEAEISDTEALENMLNRIGDSYNTIIVPMKIKGGKLNYHSSIDGAETAGANSEMEISEIIDTVKSYGYRPAASLNTMSDNLYPNADKTAGFVNKKDGKLWFDAAEKSGGKPWLAPSPSAAAYLSALTSEIASAGFEYIIATDAEYPQFSRIGLDAIGESVTNENRYLDLIDIVNKTALAADSQNKDMWLEVSAAAMFSGSCEVFQPLMLDTDKTVLKINLDDFTSIVKCGNENIDFSRMSVTEKLEKICDIAETYIYKTSFIPEVTGSYLSASGKNEAAKALESMDYNSYIIR